jgi:ferredoxin
MKATVDRETCTGCGLCPETCPEVFELDDEGLARVKADPVPADAEASAREASEGCPVDAITLQE